MAQAYDAVIATIVVAENATTAIKAMVKGTHWREGTSGNWSWSNCTLEPGKTYQFRTPLSGMSSSSTAILPNIKANVVVDWDISAAPITSVGNYFMNAYAYGCSNLKTLGTPDTTGLISVGRSFMASYAYNCSSLVLLEVPDTSNLSAIGNSFMASYANGCVNLIELNAPNIMNVEMGGNTCMDDYAANCTNLISLNAPNVQNIRDVTNSFLGSYAKNCSNLISLGIPYLPKLEDASSAIMEDYAENCNSLKVLKLPSEPSYFKDNNVNWNIPSNRLGTLIGETYYSANVEAWQELTISGKTLYTNYIRSADFIVATYIENWNGPFFDHMLFDRNKFDREINDNWEGYLSSKALIVLDMIIETPLQPFRLSGGKNIVRTTADYVLELGTDQSGKGTGGIKEGKMVMIYEIRGISYSNGKIEDLIIGDLQLSEIDLRRMSFLPNETLTIDTDTMTVVFGIMHDVSSVTNNSIFFELDKGLNDLTFSWEYEDGTPGFLPDGQLEITIIWQNRYL